MNKKRAGFVFRKRVRERKPFSVVFLHNPDVAYEYCFSQAKVRQKAHAMINYFLRIHGRINVRLLNCAIKRHMVSRAIEEGYVNFLVDFSFLLVADFTPLACY